jgi:ADP-glucose pyrophosphorylase
VDFSLDVIPNLLGKIYTYHTSAKIVDIGSLEAYYQLENDLTFFGF